MSAAPALPPGQPSAAPPGPRGSARMTRNAQLVLDMLTGRERPATAYDLYGEQRRGARPMGITPVYRALNALLEAGVSSASVTRAPTWSAQPNRTSSSSAGSADGCSPTTSTVVTGTLSPPPQGSWSPTSGWSCTERVTAAVADRCRCWPRPVRWRGSGRVGTSPRSARGDHGPSDPGAEAVLIAARTPKSPILDPARTPGRCRKIRINSGRSGVHPARHRSRRAALSARSCCVATQTPIATARHRRPLGQGGGHRRSRHGLDTRPLPTGTRRRHTADPHARPGRADRRRGSPRGIDDHPTTVVDGRSFKNYDDYPVDKRGQIPFRTAFANSCNISNNGKGSQAALSKAAAALGIGVDLDLGFPAFLGSVPAQGTGTEHAASMIGQAKIEVAPMDMATVVASVVKGSLVRPSLVVGNPAVTTFSKPAKPLQPAEARALQGLMSAVVTEGSGRVLAPSGVTVAKTGTAEYGTPSPPLTHAWMVAGKGDLAGVAYVENGVSRSQSAAPLIKAFLQTFPG